MRVMLHRTMRGSASGMMLARAMGIPAIRRRDSKYRPRWGDVVINWGSGQQLFPSTNNMVYWINDPLAVRRAINKEWAWDRWVTDGIPTVEYCRDIDTAWSWINDDERLLVRTSLTGTQGRGIYVYSRDGTEWSSMFDFEGAGDVTFVKVFGRNPQHVTEYRVHVMGGQVIDFVQKKRRRDYEGRPNPYIRSHANGWIFAREEVELPEVAYSAATRATAALGLDFGGVDLGVCRDGRVCVYEINTAPGLEGTTLRRYADELSRNVSASYGRAGAGSAGCGG